MDVPKYWTKWEKITGYETPEELHLKNYIIVLFVISVPISSDTYIQIMRKKYKERLDTYNNYCESKFDGDLNYIINKEIKIMKKYEC